MESGSRSAIKRTGSATGALKIVSLSLAVCESAKFRDTCIENESSYTYLEHVRYHRV